MQLLSGSLLEEYLGWEALTSSGSVPAIPLPSSWGVTICCFQGGAEACDSCHTWGPRAGHLGCVRQPRGWGQSSVGGRHPLTPPCHIWDKKGPGLVWRTVLLPGVMGAQQGEAQALGLDPGCHFPTRDPGGHVSTLSVPE